MLTEPREALARSSTYTLPEDRPEAIDLTTVLNSRTRLETKAIYEVRDGELSYCIAPPGRPRPEAFTTQKGDGLTLVVLKRLPEEPK